MQDTWLASIVVESKESSIVVISIPGADTSAELKYLVDVLQGDQHATMSISSAMVVDVSGPLAQVHYVPPVSSYYSTEEYSERMSLL